jgi:hypothetical protein
VVGFGVAVKANIETLFCFQCFLISPIIISSTQSSSNQSHELNVLVTAAIFFHAVDE